MMDWEWMVAGIISLFLLFYLAAALLFPERL